MNGNLDNVKSAVVAELQARKLNRMFYEEGAQSI